MRHHAEGVTWAMEAFGTTITNSAELVVPTRWVAEQHVNEDRGCIPTMADWLRCMDRQQWMKSRQVMVKQMGSLLHGEPSPPSEADRVSTSDPSGLDSRL